MSAPQVPVKKNWPRYAVSPTGDRAVFDCPGDIPPGWELVTPLPDSIEALTLAQFVQVPPKNKGGRPRKDAA